MARPGPRAAARGLRPSGGTGASMAGEQAGIARRPGTSRAQYGRGPRRRHAGLPDRPRTPVEGHAEVLGVRVHPVEPVGIAGPPGLGLGGPASRRKRRNGGPATARPRRLRSASRGRTGGSSRASGTGSLGRVVGDDQAAVDEPAPGRRAARAVRRGRRAVVAADPRSAAASSVQPPAKTESRRSSRWSVVGQQVPAPVDQRLERLLARHRGPAAAGEEPEAVVQPLGDVSARQHVDPRRGELDRERDAVEPAADLGRPARRSRRRAVNAGLRRGRPIDEQADGLGPSPPPRGRRLGRSASGHASDGTWNSASPGTASASRLVARIRSRGAAPSSRSARPAAARSRCSQLSRRSSRSFSAQEGLDRLDRGLARGVRMPERPGDLGGDRAGIAQRCELDEPGAVREAVGELAGHLDHQPRLAGPAEPTASRGGGVGEAPGSPPARAPARRTRSAGTGGSTAPCPSGAAGSRTAGPGRPAGTRAPGG